ncbi:MAG: hypothetical protein DRJ64_08425 [Thermoprotei archaeon]|nr:MAG: hypothetical protein DRJ64_08425 [Thermoprotei archaeon]
MLSEMAKELTELRAEFLGEKNNGTAYQEAMEELSKLSPEELERLIELIKQERMKNMRNVV